MGGLESPWWTGLSALNFLICWSCWSKSPHNKRCPLIILDFSFCFVSLNLLLPLVVVKGRDIWHVQICLVGDMLDISCWPGHMVWAKTGPHIPHYEVTLQSCIEVLFHYMQGFLLELVNFDYLALRLIGCQTLHDVLVKFSGSTWLLFGRILPPVESFLDPEHAVDLVSETKVF